MFSINICFSSKHELISFVNKYLKNMKVIYTIGYMYHKTYLLSITWCAKYRSARWVPVEQKYKHIFFMPQKHVDLCEKMAETSGPQIFER